METLKFEMNLNDIGRHSRGANSTPDLSGSGLPTFGAGGNPAKTTLREADKTALLTRYAGFYYQLDSRLRGNDDANE
jgi:hypothetical protein